MSYIRIEGIRNGPHMLKRGFNQCLLRPSNFAPSQSDLEVIGAFNPAAVATDRGVTLLVRVAEQAVERRPGQTALPRWDLESQRIILDWENNDALAPVDIRVVRRKRDGLVRLAFISHLRVCYSRDGRKIDSIEGAWFTPANQYEEFGVEDPRLTPLGDTYFFTYVAVSRHGAATALASTKDFKSFARHGIVFCPENKDVVLFPDRVGSEYLALHRPSGATPFTKPEMWLARSPDLIHWGKHERFLGNVQGWGQGRIGAGTPPLRTERGWLEFFHGNSRRDEDRGIGAYSAGAILMDLAEPRRILSVSGQIFAAETDYERTGFVPNVVFPTGIIQQEQRLLVYYGAADTCTAVVEFPLEEVFDQFSYPSQQLA